MNSFSRHSTDGVAGDRRERVAPRDEGIRPLCDEIKLLHRIVPKPLLCQLAAGQVYEKHGALRSGSALHTALRLATYAVIAKQSTQTRHRTADPAPITAGDPHSKCVRTHILDAIAVRPAGIRVRNAEKSESVELESVWRIGVVHSKGHPMVGGKEYLPA